MASAEDGTGVLIEFNDTNECESKEPEVYDENLVLPPLSFDCNTSTATCENPRSDVSSELEPEHKAEIFTIEDLLCSDIKTLDQEEFDFDLAMSPDASQDEDDEDEVFFGPVGFKETCVSAAVEISNSPEYRPLSPLNPSQLAELCKEANFLACRLTAVSLSDKKKKPFPKISLKDSIMKSLKKIPNFGKPGKDDELGLPRVKLDFSSPEPQQIELDVKRISERLPTGNLPLSPEGVQLFTAEQSLKDEKKVGLSKPGSMLAPPNTSRSGLQKPSKIGVRRAPSLRAPKRYSPLKRQRTNSLGSDIDNCSNASDVSDASSIGLPVTTSKRHLPSPKFQPSKSTSKQAASNPPKAKPKLNTSAIQSSLAKSSLLKPSALPNKTTTTCKSLLSKNSKAAPGSTKTGPLKATAPIKRLPSMKDNQKSGIGAPPGKENKPCAMKPPVERGHRKTSGGSTSSVGSVGSLGSVSTPCKSASTPHKSVLTPHRKDKQIHPKCLLPNSSTPVNRAIKSSSASSDMSTPASSNRRKSFLPTPKCTPRSGSTGSLSKRSPKAVFTPSNMTKKAGAPIMKKSLVMYTPQAQKVAKKPSIWSPIVRRKPSEGEEYITCTKRSSNS